MIVLIAFLILLAAAGPAHGATFNVTTTSDGHDALPDDAVCETSEGNGVCTLRAAIEAANGNSDSQDVVNLPAGTYQLTVANGGAIEFTDNEVAINGAGARTTIIQQETDVNGGLDRVFDMNGAFFEVIVSISDVTIRNGRATDAGGFFGGNIRSMGEVTIRRSVISGGRASSGGGIAAIGPGTMTIVDSLITGNSAPDGGGDSGAIQVFETADGQTATLNLVNSTISGNSARNGGGIFSWSGGTEPNELGGVIDVTNSTITNNMSTVFAATGGAVHTGDGATATFRNSILADNHSSEEELNCSGGGVLSDGGNIESLTDCGFTQEGDQQSTDPLLGGLANNGGSTDTHAIASNSPALDAALSGFCPPADQRGVTRPQGPGCDVGAFELDTVAPAVTLVNPANGSTTADTTPTLSGAAGTASGDSTTVTVKIYAGSTPTGTPIQTINTTRSGGSWSVNAAALAPGTYTARAEQVDSTGNTGQSGANTFTVDTGAPAVTLTSPANGSSTNDTTPTLSGAAGNDTGDSNTVTVKIYSGATATGTPVQTINTTRSGGSWSVDAAALAPGTYTAQAEQADGTGNTGQSSANTFTVDTTPPAVTLTSPANGSTTSDATPTLSGAAGTASGDSTTVTVKIYAGSTPTGTPVQTINTTRSGGSWSVNAAALAPGTYTAQAEQGDSAGNTGQSGANTFTVDTTPPAVTLTSPANGSTTADTTPTLSGAAGNDSGDSTTVTVKIYAGTTATSTLVQSINATASAGSWSVDAAALAPGTYTAQAEQGDSAGNTGQTGANTFTVGATPVAATDTANEVKPDRALLTGIVDTNGLPTNWLFEYGPTTAYGSQTPLETLPGAATPQAVAATASGLESDTTYHYRLLAVNAGGVSVGEDRTFTTPKKTIEDLPPPVVGKTTNVEPVSGKVLVAIPGGAAAARRGAASQKGLTFIPLEEARQIPVGSFLDTSDGRVEVQTATGAAAKTQAGQFFDGLFQILQARSGEERGLTEMRLKGSSFRRCRSGRRGKRASATVGQAIALAARKKLSKSTVRSLGGNAKGNFRTRGRHSVATVRGTIWTVADRCDGTLTKVKRGKVAVRDFREKRTVVVGAGKSFLASASAR